MKELVCSNEILKYMAPVRGKVDNTQTPQYLQINKRVALSQYLLIMSKAELQLKTYYIEFAAIKMFMHVLYYKNRYIKQCFSKRQSYAGATPSTQRYSRHQRVTLTPILRGTRAPESASAGSIILTQWRVSCRWGEISIPNYVRSSLWSVRSCWRYRSRLPGRDTDCCPDLLWMSRPLLSFSASGLPLGIAATRMSSRPAWFPARTSSLNLRWFAQYRAVGMLFPMFQRRSL